MPEDIYVSQDELIYIENVLVELRNLIPNDAGENTELLEKIVNAENIITAKLDGGQGMTTESTAN
ncbi:MAG: hypothetical protein CV087_08850 [Candidatus Brocadia sp. WS118]|nr:MAG: hypothetical protein CV087_08850 [Candidatus Brocadia sp. WS118]